MPVAPKRKVLGKLNGERLRCIGGEGFGEEGVRCNAGNQAVALCLKAAKGQSGMYETIEDTGDVTRKLQRFL